MEKFWIQNRFEASSALPRDEAGYTKWGYFDVQKFCNALLEVMSDDCTGKSRAISFQERSKAHRVEFCLQFDWAEDKSLLTLRMLDNLHGSNVKPVVQRECYTILFKKLPGKRKAQFKAPP